MRHMQFEFSKSTVFLISEFVVIVLGVLVALGFDNWSETREDHEIKMHLVSSLLMDLRQDQEDYSAFAGDSKRRARAARIIGRAAKGEGIDSSGEDMSLREAFSSIARSSRLETVETTFREMAASGSGTTIEDTVIRLKISRYYGLAEDRADLNDLIAPAMLRYRAYLEEIGMSYVDNEGLDPAVILKVPKIKAVVRELGTWAEIAVRLTRDLQEANEDLIDELEEFSR